MTNETHHINTGWLIDGSGTSVQKRMLISIRNGIISDISPFNKNDCPDSSQITDLSRCTILPPLVDCHVHLALSASTDKRVRTTQLHSDYNQSRAAMEDHLHYHFSHGVLAVRDGGDRSGHALRYNQKRNATGIKSDPVRITACGQAYHKKGRYGSFLGSSVENGKTLTTEVSKSDRSADHIKVINSGVNSFTKFGKETESQFPEEELRNLAEYLERETNRKLMIHANGFLPVKHAIEAGCHSLEHGFFMGRENLRRLAESRTVWVPTAITMKAALETEGSGGGEKKDIIRRTLEHQLQQMATAREYGVRVALGTDAGCPGVLHGESAAEELRLFLKAGYPLVEAIQCATSRGAKLLGISEMGILKKGHPANFIVARATPAMVPRKLSYLEGVYLDGLPCSRKFFNKF